MSDLVIEPEQSTTSDSDASAFRLAALEQAVVFASNHYPVATRSAQQVISDARAFEKYITDGDV